MNSDIAVVGIGLQFPGAHNKEEYWARLTEGQDLSCEVPSERWAISPQHNVSTTPQADKVRSLRGYFVDPSPFNGQDLAIELPASQLDPVFTLPIAAARQALSEVSRLEKAKTAVIMAAIALPTDKTSELTSAVIGSRVEHLLGMMPSISRELPNPINTEPVGFGAGLLAAAFELAGGAYTLDAACASSLIAVELACRELRAGRVQAALAGGLSRPSCLYTQMGFSALHALSPEGKCRPFDAQASGLVVGEGCGFVLLKTLSQALADGDHIYGLIKGCGLSNDIEGSLVAPSSEGQLRSLREAYRTSGIAPQDIDLIECHGTGTPVGDKVEFSSLCQLWETTELSSSPLCPPSAAKCALSSVKSMIGHLLTGAGIASLIRVLLSLEHKKITPQVNFDQPGVALEDSPFRIPQAVEDWPRRTKHAPRLAAVSGFGFGGTNAHLVVQEYAADLTVNKPQDTAGQSSSASKIVPDFAPIAIVGIGCEIGELKSTQAFKASVLKGESALRELPSSRWWHLQPKDCLQSSTGSDTCDNEAQTCICQALPGAYLEDIELPIGKFRIPPTDLPHILAQQSLMLKVAAQAMEDAHLPLRARREQAAAFIGIGLDLNSSNYHLRFALEAQAQQWGQELGLSKQEIATWTEELRDSLLPALDSTRTMGALGSIVASRVAREFQFGGLSYAVSAQEASGLRALDLACRSLQNGELNLALVGACDLSADIRRACLSQLPNALPALHTAFAASSSSHSPEADIAPHPFEEKSLGACPGEGAVAIVLKTLEQAQKDHDTIYSVITGLGAASAGPIDTLSAKTDTASSTAALAYDRAYRSAHAAADTISLLETSAVGIPDGDRLEAQSILGYFVPGSDRPCAISSIAPIVGYCNCVAGLASLVKASLCLHAQLLPPLPNFTTPSSDLAPSWKASRFHVLTKPAYWQRNRQDGPRRAGVNCRTSDGQYYHVIMEEACRSIDAPPAPAPLGADPAGVFPVFATAPQELSLGLQELQSFIISHDNQGLAISDLALLWWNQVSAKQNKPLCLALVSSSSSEATEKIRQARQHLEQAGDRVYQNRGVYYSPSPLAAQGRIAFIYPGSGSHFMGMGQEYAVRFPNIMHRLDCNNRRLADQFMVRYSQPYTMAWDSHSRRQAEKVLTGDTHKMMFSQVSFDILVTSILRSLKICPQAALGYSLGESAALFSLGGWPERDLMLERMEKSDLFRDKLSGHYLAARQAWHIPASDPFTWTVAMLMAPAGRVMEALQHIPMVRLLIENTDDECVVGGLESAIHKLAEALHVRPIIIHGVDAVHCDALAPVAEDYRLMHTLPCTPPAGIDFYSGYTGERYPLTSEAIAESIVNHGQYGFSYPNLVRQAYQDGVRLFFEVGPGASCTRMINKILADVPHFAISASTRGQNEFVSLLHVIAGALSQGLRPDLSSLWAAQSEMSASSPHPTLRVPIGHAQLQPPLPAKLRHKAPTAAINEALPATAESKIISIAPPLPSHQNNVSVEQMAMKENHLTNDAESEQRMTTPQDAPYSTASSQQQLIASMWESSQATAQAHEAWLTFSSAGIAQMGKLLENQTRLLANLSACPEMDSFPLNPPPVEPQPKAPHVVTFDASEFSAYDFSKALPVDFDSSSSLSTHMLAGSLTSTAGGYVHGFKPSLAPNSLTMAFDRQACLQFATGKISDVLGPIFSEIDQYPTRVRLPGEPLMLVDRIISIEGEPLSLGPGRLVTEHDVIPGMWYLDGGRAPVFLSVEAGQADLFLCSYLGIDKKTEGKRVYRLLDATVSFHRGLPVAGETVRYDIKISRFLHQGATWVFFFDYEATINGEIFLTMRNGCAGFFTHKEITDNRGLVLTDLDLSPKVGKKGPEIKTLVPLSAGVFGSEQVEALRQGNLSDCFGPDFADLDIPNPICLPSGLLRLIHRIPVCDPFGGRWSLGIVQAEADVHPDDWYLTCHFVDDMVMPGTLMYECCAHALRFLLTRLGWVGDATRIAYEPVPGVNAVLKCRGPVLQTTKTVMYQVEIKEIGYRPEPYVIADAIMYADGKRIVGFQDISMQLTGTTGQELEAIWARRWAKKSAASNDEANSCNLPANLVPGVIPAEPSPYAIAQATAMNADPAHLGSPAQPAIFDRESLLQYATGRPSLGFGPEFAPYDSSFIARLPRPPYQFLDRITFVDHPFMKMQPGGWVHAQYDVPQNAWYFQANKQGTMPFCVLLEIPLQACGWLSCYSGSATHNPNPLHYRNLGGTATLYREPTPQTGTLDIRVKMTKASEAGGLIVQSFVFWLGQGDETFYEGETTFGFFTEQALANQLGVRGAEGRFWTNPTAPTFSKTFPLEHPINPQDKTQIPQSDSLCLPGKALLMLDNVEYFAQGGPLGLGSLKGTKKVDINEWFFQAHFYQDPVIPGSLGLESFLQLLKVAALKRWPQYAQSHRFEAILTGEPHTWIYRGQVIPKNQLITVDATITAVSDGPEPSLKANGFLRVDGLTIYEMVDFGIRLISNSR